MERIVDVSNVLIESNGLVTDSSDVVVRVSHRVGELQLGVRDRKRILDQGFSVLLHPHGDAHGLPVIMSLGV